MQIAIQRTLALETTMAALAPGPAADSYAVLLRLNPWDSPSPPSCQFSFSHYRMQ